MKFLLFILFTGIPVKSHPGGIGLSGCGTPGIPSPSPCTYSPYGYGQIQIQPQPQPMPTAPAPTPPVIPQYQYPYGYPQYQVQQVQYYYPAQPAVTSNAYVTAPPSSNSAVEAFSKDSAATIAAKQPLPASFEEYEKKLKELEGVTQSPEDKAVSEIISNTTLSPVTYIKETGYLTAPPTPSPYLPRPLPYRPHPYLPTGCPVLPPQYLKPIPYYPRGYVQPIPLPTQIPQPAPVPYSYPSYYQPQVMQQPVGPIYQRPILMPPPINDCCGRCPTPCHFQHKAHALGMKTASEKVDLKKPGNSTNHQSFVPRRNKLKEDQSDVKCTSEKLKNLMNKHTMRSPEMAKRLIQKNAEAELGGYFSVFCSNGDFSYVARSDLFCQNEKNSIICYAFQHY